MIEAFLLQIENKTQAISGLLPIIFSLIQVQCLMDLPDLKYASMYIYVWIYLWWSFSSSDMIHWIIRWSFFRSDVSHMNTNYPWRISNIIHHGCCSSFLTPMKINQDTKIEELDLSLASKRRSSDENVNWINLQHDVVYIMSRGFDSPYSRKEYILSVNNG